jgi:NAD(P)H-hydrate repair Nnr-like enzyme with NAD(P)H-hydrate dehydratase domain
MAAEFLKQTTEPLFPKILWERPINKKAAKQLLIIGGHASEFSKTQMAYQEAMAAGVGGAKVVLPDSVYKLTGSLPDCLFVPSTQSGSIAKSALDEIFRYIDECDGLLMPGELSHNTETTSVVEQIVRGCTKPLVISGEVIEMLLYEPSLIFGKSQRLLLANSQTFIKLASKLGVAIKIKPSASLVNKIELLEALSQNNSADYVLNGHETIVHSNHKTSVTNTPKPNYYGDGLFTTFWLQHPNKFEALTTAAFVMSKATSIGAIPSILASI